MFIFNDMNCKPEATCFFGLAILDQYFHRLHHFVRCSQKSENKNNPNQIRKINNWVITITFSIVQKWSNDDCQTPGWWKSTKTTRCLFFKVRRYDLESLEDKITFKTLPTPLQLPLFIFYFFFFWLCLPRCCSTYSTCKKSRSPGVKKVYISKWILDGHVDFV